MVSRLSLALTGIIIVLAVVLVVFTNPPPQDEMMVTVTETIAEIMVETTIPKTEIVTTVKTLTQITAAEPLPLQKMSVTAVFHRLLFDRMIHLTHAGDGTNRLFLVLQPGQILVFLNVESVESPVVFLDIRDQVDSSGNEEGLLGLAFGPEYKIDGYFYVYYTASSPERSVISRFSVIPSDPNKADPDSELVILEVDQPADNHNGGNLIFGPDDYLYIGLGDGGGAGDPDENGQNKSTLLGTILRIDITASSSGERYRIPPDNPYTELDNFRGEIWAYGLRNPWRFTFDKETGLFWVGDVGQNGYEEVDIVKRGGNYGWNLMEGFHCFPPLIPVCDESELELPIVEYTHADGCSITGGYVYRGSRLESLYGAYVYGDFCSGKIWALRFDGSKVTEHIELIDSPLSISSFGEDEEGELYILSFDGRIYRLESRG